MKERQTAFLVPWLEDDRIVPVSSAERTRRCARTFGVEPICRLLQIAPSDYYQQIVLQRHPEQRSDRVQRDERLCTQIGQVWRANLCVYGADKVWRQLRREGVEVARCTVERLMRERGLRGVVRGKVVRTTVSDNKALCPFDRVNRQFKADRPNPL